MQSKRLRVAFDCLMESQQPMQQGSGVAQDLATGWLQLDGAPGTFQGFFGLARLRKYASIQDQTICVGSDMQGCSQQAPGLGKIALLLRQTGPGTQLLQTPIGVGILALHSSGRGILLIM